MADDDVLRMEGGSAAGTRMGPSETRSRDTPGTMWTTDLSATFLRRRAHLAVLAMYTIMMLCMVPMVASGALNWTVTGWAICGAVLCTTFIAFARLLNLVTRRRLNLRRRPRRVSRAALEARMQLLNPSVDLRRLRLLLVDRDFTGEDYQTLLDLDANNEVPSTVGASEGEIRRNPSFVIQEPPEDSVSKPKSCTICLYTFKPKERVRIIPCLHQFHTECIDPWLRTNAICPVCKFPAVG